MVPDKIEEEQFDLLYDVAELSSDKKQPLSIMTVVMKPSTKQDKFSTSSYL